MSILDKVSKKVSDTSSGLKSKVVSLSNVAKLHAEINNEERALEKLYTDLGRLHYQIHISESGFVAEDTYDAITEKISQLEAMKQQLLELKNVKVCSNCGKECPNEVIFCSGCGSRFTAPNTHSEEEKTCSNCGKECSPNALFCDGCGTQFPESAREIAAVPKNCPSCQKELSDDSVFCPSCGTKL